MLLLSIDSKYLFSVQDTHIYVYSLSSGEVVYRLSFKSPTSVGNHSVCSISISPLNKYQLVSFHHSGTVCLWDYEDGLLLKALDARLALHRIVQCDATSGIYAIASTPSSSSSSPAAASLSLYKLVLDEASMHEPSKVTLQHELVVSDVASGSGGSKLEHAAIDSKATYIAFLETRKHLAVQPFKSSAMRKKKRLNAKCELTCLALHPSEDCVATGTASGKIILWYNYLSGILANNESPLATTQINGKKATASGATPTMSMLDWHALPVLSVRFTAEGSYLLSGGHECVMVKWMFKSGQKDFKPRLGAPIAEYACSPDNRLYAIRHLDNSIHVIGTNLKVLHTFSGFVCPLQRHSVNSDTSNSNSSTLYPAGLTYFSHFNCLITNGKPGHLQFFSPSADSLLFNLDVVNENYISPESLDKPLFITEIECVALGGGSAEWLATVERRDDETTTPETKLKLWHFDTATKKFTLNTLVHFPHSFERVNTLRFHPARDILFSCGNDGCFKSYALVESKKVGSNECVKSWTYQTCNGYRDMSPSCIDFAHASDAELTYDLVGVSFQHVLTMWTFSGDDGEHRQLTLQNELIGCDASDRVREFSFAGIAHLLVVHERSLNLWHTRLVDDPNVPQRLVMRSSCVWTHTLASGSESAILLRTEARLAKDAFALALLDSSSDSTNVTIKVSALELGQAKDVEPSLKTIKTVAKASHSGRVHLTCVTKANESLESVVEPARLLDHVDVFYCDNQGALRRLLDDEGDELTSVDERLWTNRRNLAKNLPEQAISHLIDFHKTASQSQRHALIEATNISLIDKELEQIESTPAYLMPKVNTFCYETLKSMLRKNDDSTISAK